MTITNSDGQAIQTMDTTTLTTAYVDAEGNASKTATITSTNSINTKNEDGTWTRTDAITPPAQTVSLKETSKELQGTVKEVSAFKKAGKISPIQAEARQNEKENTVFKSVGGGLGTAGRAISSYVPHPLAKGAGAVVAGTGGAVASVLILTNGVRPTNPVNLSIRKKIK